jgi:hypothetical protein
MKIFGMMLLVVGMSGAAMALVSSVPEIDASSGVSAVALLSGALLVIKGRWKN